MKKRETRAVILDAAKKLFITGGYKGTTTIQIAREADISEMTLFRHFATKEDIFLSVVHPLVSFLDNFDLQGKSDLRRTIRDLLENRLSFLLEERDLVRLVVMESFLAERSQNPITGVMNRVEELFSSFAPSQRELLVRIIAGFILSAIFLPQKPKTNKYLIDTFLNETVYPLLDKFEQKRGGNHCAENSEHPAAGTCRQDEKHGF